MTAFQPAPAGAGAGLAIERPAFGLPFLWRLAAAALRANEARSLPGRPARTSRMARPRLDRRADQELLALALTTEPEAFTVFYERHVDVVLAFLRRRTSSPEVAADLMAETFAAALLALHADTEPEQLEVPVAWLLGIARNKLFESYRRGRVEAAAREKLGLEPLVLDDSDLALVDELSESDLVSQLADLLPADQLQALRARVIDEREYDEIARDLDCSEAVVRKRVSRALSTLRARVNTKK
jgi:RNA polymerase sigma-70 factor (ECF subfamily)